jgi:hypothetical protein
MTQSEEYYRAKAEECRRNATSARKPLDQEAWSKLATDWLALIRPHRRTEEQGVGEVTTTR